MGKQRSADGRSSRDLLLARAVDYLAAHGLSDLSLRQLAAALGTSHRMLIYHFGSREGLLVEVVRAVEARTREALAGLLAVTGEPDDEVARRFWRQLSDPALAPHERLFFEVYGQALQGRPHAVPLLDGIVDSWLIPGAAMLEAQGLAPDEARAEARLSLAVIRGLLLDLLATGDAEGVTAAFDRSLTNYAQRRRAGKTSDSNTPPV